MPVSVGGDRPIRCIPILGVGTSRVAVALVDELTMEITVDAQIYADSFRHLMRLRDKTAKGAWKVRGIRDPHGERFRRAAEKIYGDMVGEDPWRFFEEMTESLAYKFSNASGLDYEHAARALVNYSSDPRPGLTPLLRAIEREAE